MSDESLLPGVANASLIPIVASAVRQLGAVASGLGMGWGAFVSGDQATILVSAAIGAATIIWSTVQKVRAIIALRRAAAAPAGLPTPKLPA